VFYLRLFEWLSAVHGDRSDLTEEEAMALAIEAQEASRKASGR
jgi:hypothetical protein